MQELGIPDFVSELSKVTVQGVRLVFASTRIEKMRKCETHGIFIVIGQTAVKFEGS